MSGNGQGVPHDFNVMKGLARPDTESVPSVDLMTCISPSVIMMSSSNVEYLDSPAGDITSISVGNTK